MFGGKLPSFAGDRHQLNAKATADVPPHFRCSHEFDVRNQDVILDLIREACAESKVALLMVTHSTDVAARFPRVDRLEAFNRAAGVTR